VTPSLYRIKVKVVYLKEVCFPLIKYESPRIIRPPSLNETPPLRFVARTRPFIRRARQEII
jgi:hypothetical protein